MTQGYTHLSMILRNMTNSKLILILHISSLSKKCANLLRLILRTFYTRDCITMLTLFKSSVLSRLDYGSQLWSPFLIKYITQLEKIQRSFTKHIKGMNDMPYHEQLKSLGFYSLQRRRERYCVIYIGKLLTAWLLIFLTLLQVHFLDVEACHASFPMSM